MKYVCHNCGEEKSLRPFVSGFIFDETGVGTPKHICSFECMIEDGQKSLNGGENQ